MKTLARTFLGLTLSIVTTGNAMALGLGNATGQAVLGEPLRIEIALIGTEAGLPAIECFSLRPPQAEIASHYVLRNAQLQLLGEPGRARLALSSSATVQEPVLEFALAVGCGFELARDYVLLSEEPGRATSTISTIQLAAASAAASTKPPDVVAKPTKSAVPAPPSALPAQGMFRIDTAQSLTALAQRQYPLQPKAREKFMRMVLLANPGLGTAESLIESGTDLQMPAGLPLRRLPGSGTKPAAGHPSISRQPARPTGIPAGSVPTRSAPKPATDRLVLGAPLERERNPVELLAEAERLAAVLLAQTQAQDAVSEKINKLDETLVELKKHFIGMSDRLSRIEAERQAEKSAAKPASLDFLELLLAVGAGGLMGALGLYLFTRGQFRRAVDVVPASGPVVMAASNVAAPKPPSQQLRDLDLTRTEVVAPDNPLDHGQEQVGGLPTASLAELTTPAAAQNDFDFSVTAPDSLPGRGPEPEHTNRKALP